MKSTYGIGIDLTLEDSLTTQEILPGAVMENNIRIPVTQDTTLTTARNIENTSEDEIPRWRIVMDQAQLGLTSVGFLANIMTFITLRGSKVKFDFNPVVLLLLRHQSIIDGLVCLVGTLLMVLPPMWNIGIYWLDTVVCHLWHSQFLYWILAFLSTYSLILIAVERYFAVCRPFKHQVNQFYQHDTKLFYH